MMFVKQFNFINWFTIVCSFFHSIISTLMFNTMVTMHIGIVRNKKLNSNFLFMISVFSKKISNVLNMSSPKVTTTDWFMSGLESYWTVSEDVYSGEKKK